MALLALVVAQMMFYSILYSLLFFAAGMFAVLNGPLWLSVRVGVFSGSRQSPPWVQQTVTWLSRLVGIAILVVWAWISTGAPEPALLLCLILFISLLCLLDVPRRLMERAAFLNHGSEAPAWTERSVIWFIRLVGAVGLLGGFLTGIWASIG